MNPKALGPKLGLNYYKVQNPEIIDEVVQFISQHPDQDQLASQTTLVFVKNFTKVACNIIEHYEEQGQAHPFNQDQLIWIYNLNNEGINKIILNQYQKDKHTELSIQRMHSHFYSHMANIAEMISGKSEDQDTKLWWLDRAYEDSFYSIVHGEETDSHPDYQLQQKSKIAGIIAKSVKGDEQKREKWIGISIEDAEDALEKLSEIDPDHCVYLTLQIAGIYSYQASLYNEKEPEDLEKKIQILKKAHSAYIAACQDLEKINITDFFTAQIRIGEIGFLIYNLTGKSDEQWLESASENIESVISHSGSVKKDKLHRAYFYRARINLEHYKASQNINFLEKAYEGIAKAIDLTKEADDEKACMVYINAKIGILKKFLEVEKDKTRRVSFLVDAIWTYDEIIKEKTKDEEKGMCYTFKASYESELAELALKKS